MNIQSIALILIILILVIVLIKLARSHQVTVAKLKNKSRKLARNLKKVEDKFSIYEEAMDQSRVYVYKKNLNTLQYEYMDPRISKLLSISPKEIGTDYWDSNINIRSMRDEFDGEDAIELVQKFNNGEVDKWTSDVNLKLNDGTGLWMADEAKPIIDADGNVTHSIGTLRDITWRKTIEEEISKKLKFEVIKQKLLINVLKSREPDFDLLMDEHFGDIGVFCGFKRISLHRVNKNKHELHCVYAWVEGENVRKGSPDNDEDEQTERVYQTCKATNQLLNYVIENEDEFPNTICFDHVPKKLRNLFPDNCEIMLFKLFFDDELYGFFHLIRTSSGDLNFSQKSIVLGSHVQILTILMKREEELLGFEIANKQVENYQRFEAFARMAGAIVHEFNNQMTGMYCHLELIKETVSDDETMESVDEMDKVLKKNHKLLKRMEAYSGHNTTHKELVALDHFFMAHRRILEAEVRSPHKLLIDIGENCVIRLNEPEFLQVIVALVNNAVESVEGKSGVVSLNATKSHYFVEEISSPYVFGEMEAGEYVRLSISDNGCGIKTKLIDQIFDPFFSTKFIGRGMGLSFVHGVVRKYKGTITVDSKVNDGTEIRIYLPTLITDPASE